VRAGLRLVRGRALGRADFEDFTRISPYPAGWHMSERWAGRLGDGFLSHSFSWMSSRWFGVSLASAGDLAIQWFWPGIGDVWNYGEYGLTPGQFVGRGAVAMGGGLLAWGTVELTTATLVAGGVFAAPAEVPFILGAGIFMFVEGIYEWQVKRHLYEWFNLKGTSEP
jgi:hypothetical protein